MAASAPMSARAASWTLDGVLVAVAGNQGHLVGAPRSPSSAHGSETGLVLMRSMPSCWIATLIRVASGVGGDLPLASSASSSTPPVIGAASLPTVSDR
jgi:hypothetical protein